MIENKSGNLAKQGVRPVDQGGIAELREKVAGSRPTFHVVSRELSDGSHLFR